MVGVWFGNQTDEGSEEKEESSEEEDKDLEDIEACRRLRSTGILKWFLETTMCYYDGLIWWCEDGVWLNEDDNKRLSTEELFKPMVLAS